jgi:hypothetical protein
MSIGQWSEESEAKILESMEGVLRSLFESSEILVRGETMNGYVANLCRLPNQLDAINGLFIYLAHRKGLSLTEISRYLKLEPNKVTDLLDATEKKLNLGEQYARRF